MKNWLSSSSPACFIWVVPADFFDFSSCDVCVDQVLQVSL